MKNNPINDAITEIKSKFEYISEENRKKLLGYIYITLTLFTVSFFGFFAIAPTLNTISNLNKQYEDNKLVKDALSRKLTNLQLLDFQYQEIQPDLVNIYSAIPRTPQIPKLTRQIETIAETSNVSVLKLSVGNMEVFPNTKREAIYSFTFTVTVVGNENSVNAFTSNIINFDRIIGIDRIVTGIDEEKRYTATITGRAYYSSK